MNNLGFIEPCCIHRQLPPLLLNNRGRYVHFATSGDVLLEHFMSALLQYAEGNDGQPVTLYIVMPEVDVPALRWIAHVVRRRWAGMVYLYTRADQSELIHTELPYSCVRIASHDMLAEGLVLMQGSRYNLLVQGHLSQTVQPAHRFYTAVLTENAEDLDPFLRPLRPKLK